MGAWTDATDRQLLLTMYHLNSPAHPKWNEVAALMGDGFTAESTRQHFQKLNKDYKKTLGGVSGAPAAKSTSRKAKDTKSNGKATGKSAMKRKGDHVSDDEEGSLTKKAKLEPVDDEDVDQL